MFGQKVMKPLRLPTKLKNRERALRNANKEIPSDEAAHSGSYVFCQDGTLIPIDDPDLLDIITRANMSERM